MIASLSENQAIGLQGASAPTEPKRVQSESETEAAKKNLSIRVAPSVFQKYTDLRTKRGLETNEQLLESLIQDNEQVEILKRQLGDQAAKTKVAEKVAESVKYENYVRMPLAVPKTLMPVIGKLRESLKAQGYNIPLSAAVNLCVLHFIFYSNKFQVTKDEFEALDKFLTLGPGSIDLEELNKFLAANFKLEPEAE